MLYFTGSETDKEAKKAQAKTEPEPEPIGGLQMSVMQTIRPTSGAQDHPEQVTARKPATSTGRLANMKTIKFVFFNPGYILDGLCYEDKSDRLFKHSTHFGSSNSPKK